LADMIRRRATLHHTLGGLFAAGTRTGGPGPGGPAMINPGQAHRALCLTSTGSSTRRPDMGSPIGLVRRCGAPARRAAPSACHPYRLAVKLGLHARAPAP